MKFVILLVVVSLSHAAPNGNSRGTPVQVQLRRVPTRSLDEPESLFLKIEGEGHNYDIPLTRPASPVFSPHFQYTVATLDSAGEPILVPRSTPKLSAKVAEVEANIFVNTASNSVVQVKEGDVLEGIIHGNHAILSREGDGSQFIVKHSYEPKTFASDGLYLNDTDETTDGSAQEGGKGPITVEVQVYIDYDSVQHLGRDHQSITEYVAIFFHSVKARYASAFPNKELSIDIVIAGITHIDNRSNQPFIENHINKDGGDLGGIVLDFAKYIHKGPYDLVVLLMGWGGDKNLVEITGKSYHGGVCQFDVDYDIGIASAAVNINRDRYADYEGVHSTVHSIGHNLGAHDDGTTSNQACPSTDGYIMANSAWQGYGQSVGPHRYRFSPCSIKDIKKRTQTGSYTECLYKTDAKAPIPISRKWDGDMETFDDICRKEMMDPTAVAIQQTPDDMCKVIKCCSHVGEDGFCEGVVKTIGANVPDHIPCGDKGGKCWESRCV